KDVSSRDGITAFGRVAVTVVGGRRGAAARGTGADAAAGASVRGASTNRTVSSGLWTSRAIHGNLRLGKPNPAAPNCSERICTWMSIETDNANPRRARERV